jgi:methylenetetrahydrofolate dehydrogenase (NADP+)/methenyltetrahydrofolate cyclohydrolase
MPLILDGKALATSIRGDLHELVTEHNLHPCLAIVTVGDDPASAVYVRNKKKACDEIGIVCRHECLPANTTESNLIKLIKELNRNEFIHGIIVQLPLPKHINPDTVTEAIWRSKDVDGFGQKSLFHPCTPEGVIRLLDHHLIPIESRNVVIIGRSNIVGRPLARMMLDRNANVTVLHSKTTNEDRHNFLTKADIIVSAVGSPMLVVPNDITPYTTIVDVGINRDQNGKLCGDVHPLAYEFSHAYTPVPGGVGPMTVAMLMEHVVQSAIWQQEQTKEVFHREYSTM